MKWDDENYTRGNHGIITTALLDAATAWQLASTDEKDTLDFLQGVFRKVMPKRFRSVQ